LPARRPVDRMHAVAYPQQMQFALVGTFEPVLAVDSAPP
jgi:hypothetical protein